ncbi:MAG: Maf family protein [Dehalococcoidia bacterium]
MSRPLVLASASPRRRELLASLDVPFDVRPSTDEERSDASSPDAVVRELALSKATAVAALAPGRAVLGADTTVVLDGESLGKPSDAAEAASMLRALRGRTHDVFTGVAVVEGETTRVGHVVTRVRMRAYSDREIDRYVAGGSPFDKAGAYAIQDGDFAPVERHEGCECSVIGLPLWTARRLLREAADIEGGPPPFERCAGCPEREVTT